MFRNRRTSQKPSDELYKTFKANFPGLGQPLTTTTAGSEAGVPATDEGLDVPLRAIDGEAQPDLKDSDPTPRPHNDQWNFASSGLTPALMDPNSHAFNMFANQMPGYYTPTPGGTNTLYHSQAGDLHTPNLGAALNTPLSLSTSEGIMHAGHQTAFHPMQPHLPQQFQQQFHNLNPFQAHHHQHPPQQQGFAPHQFTHQPSYDHIDTMDGSPMGDMGIDVDMHQSHHASPELMMHPQSFAKPLLPQSQHPTGDKFRWHATLNAPTAMIKSSDEIPITYLNKGQAYTLNVVDTHAQRRSAPVRYRTFVRVSFEDEQQRQRPAACWQLWKEGRGTNEAHQRGGRLQAVEYVASSSTNTNDPSKPRMELECASFDGFCVLWTPANGASECPISVRFNFLSTDFSHSKGVKGIPVRLCAKTQVVGEDQALSEVCYCKVKLFRDHGAERKLSNDVAHVKKSIDKLSQQIQQLESGTREGGKRKRSGSLAKGGIESGRPGKIAKHRRTWSMSSVTSSSARGGAEEDLHIKLMTLNDMFTSTRPASVLYLRGAEEDDPDLQPVKLSGETVVTADLKRIDSVESANWEHQSTTGQSSSLVSPSPSNHSLTGSRRDSNLQQPTPFGGSSRVNSSDWRSQPQTAVADIPRPIQQLATPLETHQPIKVQTRSPTSGTLSGWVEAVDVDQTYQPPDERPIKPVACFYVQPRIAGKPSADNFHRAIYLMNRTLKDFVNGVAAKSNIEPTKVIRTYRVSRTGLQVLFDDECIQELAEGQDMTAEFSECSEPISKPAREWDVTDIQVDGDLTTLEDVQTTGYELKLLY
ncbi:hypothetical protein AMS68_006073 [Peltaster fructicola]|uniref:Grh/CP2 DB domain-containing protein n=1 Tax=Peltaster fructicola TaxID=286661 RepID=A0A6H0Y0U8_9PEZI|nr:hypothetical protein AMS68_006073 [Peltaster fructicola]